MSNARARLKALEERNGPDHRPIAIVLAREPDDHDKKSHHGEIHTTDGGGLTLSVDAARKADPMKALTRQQRKALDASEYDQVLVVRGRSSPVRPSPA